jgi:IS30 family transposase
MGNPYHQLTLTERYQIQALKELEYSARKIGQKIGRSNKTISGELQRCTAQAYSAETAHQGACQRRQQAPKAHKKSA